MVELDLLRDQCQIQEYVWNRLDNYEPDWDRALGDTDRRISLISTGFSFEQSGWFSMVFDRRPRATSDGEWQSLIGNNYLPCLLYTSPSPRDLSTSRMPSSA